MATLLEIWVDVPYKRPPLERQRGSRTPRSMDELSLNLCILSGSHVAYSEALLVEVFSQWAL
jgi:hypothetical protein